MKIFRQYGGLSREVYIIALSKLVQSVGAFIWPLFVLILKQKLFMSPGEVSAFLVVGMIVSLISSLAGGVIADKIGRKRTIVIFQFIGMLMYSLVVVFDIGFITAILLMAGMMFYGLTGPAHDALMANITKTEERETAYSLSYLLTNLGIVIGPAIGGLLLTNHFTLFILIDVFTSFLGWLLLLSFVKEKHDKQTINELEQEVKEPVLKIIKDRPVIIFYGLVGLFTSFSYGQLDFALPLYIDQLFGESSSTIFGFLFSFNGLVVVLFTSLITYILRRMKALRKMFYGFLVYTIVIFAYSVVDFTVGLFALMFIFTIAEIMLSIGSGPILSKIVPTNILGRVTGFLYFFYMGGHILAITIPGPLIDNGMSFKSVWLILGCLSSIGLIYFSFFIKRYGHIIDKVDEYDVNRTR